MEPLYLEDSINTLLHPSYRYNVNLILSTISRQVVINVLSLWIAALAGLAVSFFFNRNKTAMALKKAWKIFSRVCPLFITVLVLASLSLGLISEKTIVTLLSGKGLWFGTAIGALAGSVTAMPGFVAFPLAGILLDKGVPYTVLAAFTTTLMMVGFLSFPLEKSFVGTKVAILRNLSCFAIALVVAVVIGLAFGEIVL